MIIQPSVGRLRGLTWGLVAVALIVVACSDVTEPEPATVEAQQMVELELQPTSPMFWEWETFVVDPVEDLVVKPLVTAEEEPVYRARFVPGTPGRTEKVVAAKRWTIDVAEESVSEERSFTATAVD